MGDLIILGKRERYEKDKYFRLDTTSGNIVESHRKSLSPFFLGPVECYGGHVAQNVENAWQYSKVYKCHVDENGNPTEEYFKWRDKGWACEEAHRHPMGKEIPLYSYWEIEGKPVKLGYIEGRKKIYIPMYAQAVFKNPFGLDLIKSLLRQNNVALADFDGYNHKALGQSYYDVLNNPLKKMGHAFVLGMLINDYVRLEEGQIVVDEEMMKDSEFEQVRMF